MRSRHLRFLLLLALAVICVTQPVTRPDGLYAEVQTSKGLIVIQLKPEYAPIAVASFVGLAEGTIANAAFDPGRPFFDGTTFHRVVSGHVIQTGIPASDRAKGPGYTFPNEIDARLSHNHAGAVNMANGGPGTNASQWCITLGDRSYLDGDFTVFGEVVTGLDVVLSIRQGDGLQTVRIVRVGAAAAAYHPTTASFQALVKAAELRATAQVGLKKQAEADWIAAHYPRATAFAAATGPASGVLTENVVTAPVLDAAAATTLLHLRYHAQLVRYAGDWQGRTGPPMVATSFTSGAAGVPWQGAAQTFDYEPGKSKLNPGLDSVIGTMHAGDRRTVIVPAAKAYGRAGLYPPEVPGQPRFVINPNVMLVYDLEALP